MQNITYSRIVYIVVFSLFFILTLSSSLEGLKTVKRFTFKLDNTYKEEMLQELQRYNFSLLYEVISGILCNRFRFLISLFYLKWFVKIMCWKCGSPDMTNRHLLLINDLYLAHGLNGCTLKYRSIFEILLTYIRSCTEHMTCFA